MNKVKKPEKKTVNFTSKQWIYDDKGEKIGHFTVPSKSINALSYNQAIDDYEKFQPTEEEIAKILLDDYRNGVATYRTAGKISKRLGR